VLVVSPREHLGEADRWIRAGATDVVTSPVNIEALGEALQRVIEGLQEDTAEEPGYRFVASERGVWEITAVELATMRFPLYIAERLYRSGRIDKLSKLRLELAFQEALLNGLDHGNLELDSAWREEIDDAGVDRYSVERRRRLSDPFFAQRKIFIETALEGVRLTIRIRDEGRGFTQSESASRETQPLCSGRGLAIIKGSVDEVHFAHNGTEITLIKVLSS
jgi:anti-sigma regulatory factor (Ser/Thr protein kinase)